MKTVNELLDALAQTISELRENADVPQFNDKDFDKAQQLVGQIRFAHNKFASAGNQGARALKND